MYSENNLLRKNRFLHGKGEVSSLRQQERDSLTYIYIGDNASLSQFLLTPKKAVSGVTDFANAKVFVESVLTTKCKIPDAIIIDIPFTENDFLEFCFFLKQKPAFSSIPMLYNRKQLNEDQIIVLKKKELVDDILRLEDWGEAYINKVIFLKKIKNHPPSLHISRQVDHILNEYSTNKRIRFKRFFDVVVSAFALISLLPLFLLIAIAIRLESRGPVFYAAKRAGMGFKIFPFFKFRTMEVDADKKIESLAHLNKYCISENGVKFLKIDNDPRVTSIGKYLRKTSLDELPQLFNVLKGDMSLVGNRPLPIYEAITLTTNDFVERFMVPAGITGLWQIKKKKYPNMTAEERVGLDIAYAREYSFLFDLKIITKTPGALFQRNNA